jgi:hypothetical protein
MSRPQETGIPYSLYYPASSSFVDVRMTHAEPRTPTPVQDIVCGSTKLIAGCLSFPIVCPLSLVAGTGMTVYGCLCCRLCDPEFLGHRNDVCRGFGVVTAYRLSSSLFQTGSRQIRRTCCVEHEMVR